MADTTSSQSVPPVTLASQDLTVTLDGKTNLDSFIRAANDKSRIKGLADELNPRIIDPAKLRSMVAALPSQPDSVHAALSGHRLNVGTSGLGVLAVEPTAPGAFGPDYHLTIERTAGVHVLAHASLSFDAPLAKQRTAAAKEAVSAAHKAVHAIEKGKTDPDGLDLGDARWRRAQAASGWAIAARAWHAAEPDSTDAQKALAEAEKAVKEYGMPSGAKV